MAERHRYRFDETKFKDGQKLAAILLVEREFTPKGERKTTQEIADEIGVCRKTLYNWDTKDDNFIEYKKYLSAQTLDTHMPMVYARLLESIDKRYSVRAMELFMKRAGDLADNSEITIKSGEESDKSTDERLAELKARLGVAEGEGKEGESKGES